MSEGKKTEQNILIDVKVQKKIDGDWLVFVYEDESSKDYKIHEVITESKGLRFINKKDSENKTEKYFLVEDETYIKTKIDKKDYNFRKHIFLGGTDFSYVNFVRTTDFSDAKFYGEVKFSDAKFYGEVKFSDVEFYESVYFFDTFFFKEVNFFGANFFKDIIFLGVKFPKDVYFMAVSFFGRVNFSGVEFFEIVNFSGAKFSEESDFSEVVFFKEVNFSNIKCQNRAFLNFHAATFHNKFSLQLNVIKKQKLVLDLSSVSLEIKSFNYNNSLIESLGSETDRETYSRLKDVALTRHDHIIALKLHKREYEVHYLDLKTKLKKIMLHHVTKLFSEKYIQNKTKNDVVKKEILETLNTRFSVGDFLILLFEKKVSYFGTSILRSVLSWIVVFSFFGALIILIYKGSNSFGMMADDLYDVFIKHQQFKDLLTYAFHPIFLIPDDSFLNNHSRWWVLACINFFKTILLSVITYEILKSFRKFSRKL